jgi:hypothetical protein
MDLESKYCYFYHSWDFVPYYKSIAVLISFISIKRYPQGENVSNISAISWRPALVVEEAGVPGE